MKISRRNFLAAAPIAAGVALQFNVTVLGQLTLREPSVGADVLSRLKWNSFYPYMNTVFTFRDAAGSPVDLRLTNMVDLVPLTPGLTVKNGESFSLVFSGPASHPLMQDVYAVEHFA